MEENQENGETGTQESTETEELNGTFVESQPAEPTDESQDTEQSGEKPFFDQESANKAFITAKQKQRDAEKKAADALKEAEELKAKLASKQSTGEPAVPPLPVEFDFETTEEYNKAIEKRDAAIEARGQYKRDQALKQEQTKAAQHEAYQTQQDAIKKNVESYQERAKVFNIDEKELAHAEQVFGTYVQSPEIARFLLANENGPLAVSYLAKNPQELEKIAAMDPMTAAVHISTNVMPSAIKAAPKGTQTPPPLTIPGGRGVVDSDAESRDPNLAGGQFV